MKRNFLSIHSIHALGKRYAARHTRKLAQIKKVMGSHDLSYGDRVEMERSMVDIGTSSDHHELLDSNTGYYTKQRMLLVHDRRRTKHNEMMHSLKGQGGRTYDYDDSVTDRILNMHLHDPTDVDDCGVSARIRNDIHAFGSHKHREILQKHYPNKKVHGF